MRMPTVLVVVALAALAEPSVAGGGDLLVRDVVLIDGTGGEARVGVDVLVRAGRIVRIDDERIDRRGHDVVDGRGRYLVPGLVDAHSHPFPVDRSFAQYLRFGVTSIFVPGCGNCDDQTLAAVRARTHAPGAAAPRVFHTSQHFTMEGRHPAKTYVGSSWVDGKTIHYLDDVDEIGPLVERVTRQPIVGIKVTIEDGPTPPWVERIPQEFVDEIVVRAHAAGTKVFAHVSDDVELKIAAQAGVDHLLHFTGVDLDWERDRPMLEDFRARGLHWVTTMMLDKSFLYPIRPAWIDAVRETGFFDVELDRLMAEDVGEEATRERVRQVYGSDDASFDTHPVLVKQSGDLRRLHEFGIPLVVGTDVGSPWIFPGYAVHEEMILLEAAGIPARDVLVMATRNAATMLGVADDLGTLAVGKVADMVLVERDPRVRVRNLRSIVAVYRDGIRVGP